MSDFRIFCETIIYMSQQDRIAIFDFDFRSFIYNAFNDFELKGVENVLHGSEKNKKILIF
jgi:hypothetical protein